MHVHCPVLFCKELISEYDILHLCCVAIVLILLIPCICVNVLLSLIFQLMVTFCQVVTVFPFYHVTGTVHLV